VHALIQEVVEKAGALRLDILGNIRSGYVALAEATRRVAIDQEQVEEAKESYRLAERRYRSGISQYLELTNARSVLNRARAELEQARFDRKLAEFQVMNELEILP
jgi:outer membrane protein TolC